MTPEQLARKEIDSLLAAAGWHVCGMADADILAARGVAIREFPLFRLIDADLRTPSDVVPKGQV
jgi:hypothetical protein